MSGFTQGPWTVGDEYDQATCCCASEKRIQIMAGKEEIAQALGESDDYSSCTPEAHANALLIAAAPALLRAISKLLLGPAHPDWAAHVDEARAARAKAEGK